MALTPTVNILRVPLWGRAFETFSEDPFLTSQLAVAEIRGVQSQHVIATVKHFAANNQETLRGSIDVQVGERTAAGDLLPRLRGRRQGRRTSAR